MWWMLWLLGCGSDRVEVSPAPGVTPSAEMMGATGDASTQNLYSVDVPLVGADGAASRFDVGRGQPTLMSMFYTSCASACPILISDIQSVLDAVPEPGRDQVRVVLVSMDPAHDDPAALRATIEKHSLGSQWTLSVPEAQDVREISAALGVRYREDGAGGFSHTSIVSLVDPNGALVARAEGAQGREALIGHLNRLIAP